VGQALRAYAQADPAAVCEAAGATGAFIAALGSVGHATRRDLSAWTRMLSWALLVLITFGVGAIFFSIQHANIIYAIVGLLVFVGFTVLDFNRLRSSGVTDAAPIATSIFLVVFQRLPVHAATAHKRAGLSCAARK
jgi:uncharacterized protein